jgi:hypothetical protein
MSTTIQPGASLSWQEANWRCLEGELRRMRLLAERRALWLRRLRSDDPGAGERALAIDDAQADRLLSAGDRRIEWMFYRADAGALHIQDELPRLGAELDRERDALRAAGRTTSLDALVRLFDLTPFERDVVLLCLAPSLDTSFERIYGYLHDDATRNYATPSLALSLLLGPGDDAGAAWHSFQAHSSLRHFNLVVTGEETNLAALPLRLPERIAAYLQGFNRLDSELALSAEAVAPVRIAGAQSELAGRLAAWAGEGLGRGERPRLNLVGRKNAGRREIAAEVCQRLGLSLFAFDWRRLSAARPEIFRLIEREAVLLQFAVLLEPEPDPADVASRRLLEDLARSWKVFMIVASEETWPFESAVLAVRAPKAGTTEQGLLWREALGRHAWGDVDRLVEQFDLGPALIERAARQASEQAALRSGGSREIAGEDLWRACLSLSGSGLEGMAQRIESCHNWDDIVVPSDIRRLLEEIASQVANRAVVYRDWGFGKKLNRGRGISALFSGASGTGKTLAAEVLANHLRLELYRIDLSSVVSKYIGETEKNLRRVFDAAESSGAILFFDEADALFGKRSEVKDSHDRYANIEIDYLLQRMEEYRGLAILATNMKAHMDTAFLRRLRFVVEFPFPDAGHRRRIWEKVFPPETPRNGIRFDLLSRLEMPGANIRNIALNAAFLAVSEGKPVDMRHLTRAAHVEYAKEERVMSHPELDAFRTEPRGRET